jgi:hypothetical protein
MSSASATSLVDTPLVWSLLTIHCLTTYKEACQRGEVAIGKMLVVETNQLHGRTYVVNFPTKKHWRAPSQLSYIDAGLVDLVVPLLYCTNHGGRQANSNFPTLELLSSVVAAAGDIRDEARCRAATPFRAGATASRNSAAVEASARLPPASTTIGRAG